MSKRNFGNKDSAKYHRLAGDGNCEFTEKQFEKPPVRVPYKAIILAIILFIVGSILITLSALLITGHIDAKYGDRTWPLMILGSLMFVPGSYHVYIAFKAWQGVDGYSYDDIPDYADYD